MGSAVKSALPFQSSVPRIYWRLLPEDATSFFGGSSGVRVPFPAFPSQQSRELKMSLRCVHGRRRVAGYQFIGF